jgi:hypothetical protein
MKFFMVSQCLDFASVPVLLLQFLPSQDGRNLLHSQLFFGVRGGLYGSSLWAMLCIFRFSLFQKIIFRATLAQWKAFLFFDML